MTRSGRALRPLLASSNENGPRRTRTQAATASRSSRYLTWKARELDFQTRVIELAGEVNQNMPYCRSRAS
jgi:hypothetical protein